MVFTIVTAVGRGLQRFENAETFREWFLAVDVVGVMGKIITVDPQAPYPWTRAEKMAWLSRHLGYTVLDCCG